MGERAQPTEAPLTTDVRLFLVGVAILGPFALNTFKPCLPWIKADLGAPIEAVQLGLSLAILAAAFASIGSGYLSDRLGRRPVLVVSVYLFLVSSVAAAAAPNVEVLVASRVVQAASSSVALAVGRALIHDLGVDAQKVIGRISMIAIGAVLLTPLLATVMIDLYSWRAALAVSAAVGLVPILPMHRAMGRPGPWMKSAAERARALSLGPLLRSRVFYGYALQAAFHFSLFLAFTSAAAYLMVDALHRPATEFGLWFIGLALCLGSGLGLAEGASTRLATGRIALLGSGLVLLGGLASAYLLTTDRIPLSPVTLFLPAAPAAFGVGLALPATNGGILKILPELAGTASGSLTFLQMLFAALFAQWVVRDEARTAEVLAEVLIVGGVGSFLFGFLSADHRVPAVTPATTHT